MQAEQSKEVRSYDGGVEYTDPAGTYAGFSICANCSGVGVRLQLTDARGTEEHGTFKETVLYLDAPTHSKHGAVSKDQEYIDRGTWQLLPARPGGVDRQLCLTTAPLNKIKGGEPDCYHLVHQIALVFINSFEKEHQPDPFPSGLNTLLKQRLLSDGNEYPMLPVDTWTGFSVLPNTASK